MELAKKSNGTPPCPPRPRELPCTQFEQETKVLLNKTCPGGGGWGKRCFHDSGVLRNLGRQSSLASTYPELLLKWVETHIFHVTPPNHQHGCFWAARPLSQPKVLSRQTSECCGAQAFPPWSGGTCGAVRGPWAAEGRAPAGNHCAGRDGSSVLVSGVVTVKASIHSTWQ